MTATVYFVNRQSNKQYFLFLNYYYFLVDLIFLFLFFYYFFKFFLFITCTCRLCKLSRCNFYGTFAFKRAIAHMRYVVK